MEVMRTRNWNRFICLAAWFSLLMLGTSQAEVIVDVSITEPAHHLAQVTLTLPVTKQNSLILQLPTWRTGNYRILNLANGIRLFSASADGQALEWRKVDKSSWQIDAVAGKQVTVSYQVYANELGKRTRHIDDSHAFLDASTLVMYNEKLRTEAYILNFDVPNQWQLASGLAQGTHAKQLIADNYDVLADSPIEVGIQQVYKFKVENRDYSLVIWGAGNYDGQKMVDDLAIMVKQASAIWHDYPFSRYVFMVHATSGEKGATEHVNSTIIQRSRFQFHDRKDYLGFLLTAAHEFVHTWNVKQYRPEGLFPYDYQNENYSNLEAQLLLRGELMTVKEFCDELAKQIEEFQHKPGRAFQSVAQSSFDKWIEQGGDYDNNFSVNIYDEGFMVSWQLDMDLLVNSKGARSFRDVHHALYKDYRLPYAFNEQDVLTILQQQSGSDYRAWWQQHVHGRVNPDFNQLLASVGLEMSHGTDDKQIAWSGISTKHEQQGVIISKIEKDSPAWLAGLAVGDIIVAVNELRLNETDLTKRLLNFKPNETINISYFRRDQLAQAQLTLVAAPKDKLSIRPVKAPTEQQKLLFKAWTSLDFSSEIK
jgi:predicted metalloprotease with PDZ domain